MGHTVYGHFIWQGTARQPSEWLPKSTLPPATQVGLQVLTASPALGIILLSNFVSLINVKSYLTVILTSQISNDLEYLIIYAVGFSNFFFCKLSVLCFAHLVVVFSFLLIHRKPLDILDIKSLVDLDIANIFSQFVGYLLPLSIVFHQDKSLILM